MKGRQSSSWTGIVRFLVYCIERASEKRRAQKGAERFGERLSPRETFLEVLDQEFQLRGTDRPFEISTWQLRGGTLLSIVNITSAAFMYSKTKRDNISYVQANFDTRRRKQICTFVINIGWKKIFAIIVGISQKQTRIIVIRIGRVK